MIQLKNETVYDQISEITRQVPNKIAIQQGDRSLSYTMLERGSNQLANLLATNVEKNKNIVTILENGIELVQAAVGIMKGGCVFVPVDSNYPDNRIRMMIEKVDTSWIVTTSYHFDKLQRLFGQELQHIRIILIDGEEFELIDANIKVYYLKDYNDTAMIWERNPYSYIYFTSGSTGTPKAILGRHRSLKHFIDWEIREFQIDKNCIGSQFTSPSFDPFLRDIFVPLCAGGTVCIPENRGLLFSSQELKQWISINKITLIHIIPTLFRVLMEEVSSASSFPSLKYVVLAGELLRGQDVKKFLNIFEKRIHLINLYGPSETTLAKMYYRIQPDDEKRLTIPIGKPIDSTQILILDTGMQPIPMGSIGEIYIRTPYISAGYYKDKDLNRDAFIKNPFNSNKNDILYKTGDKGRLLASGDFEIIGRMDNQVKINGIRIEPEEIENRLISYPDIKQAVIVAHENDLGDKYLSAYIVSDEDVSSNELRQRLLESLPDYMIPLYFVRMDKFPLTPNGKVNRQALLAPKGEVHAEYVAPRNTTEEMLMRIWKEVLNKNKIGIYDNFFELGGNSLRGTVLVTRIHKELNVEVPLKELFRMPTIAGISEYLLEAKESIYASIEPIKEKEYYETSSAQKRMWVLQEFDQESTAYNMPGVLKAEGKIDKQHLEAVFSKLIKYHESLRTSFHLAEEVVQRISERVAFQIEYTEETEEQADDVIKGFIRPFDLSQAPLLRVGIIKTGEDRHYLMFDTHHIISDGVSMSILIREFIALYGGEVLEAPRIGYKDFSVWQNEYLKSEGMQEQEKYWLERFSDEIPILDLPLDYVRPVVQSFEGASEAFRLGSGLTEKINDLARETGTTMYMVLLSMVNILLSKYSGQADIIIGSPIAGRHHADLEGIIGMFVNTLVMRNYPESGKTYEEFLSEVKETALKAYENQDYQFEELVDKMNLRRDVSRNPLFDVMFELQNIEKNELEIEGLSFTEYESSQGLAKFDLTFSATEVGDEIVFNVEYGVKLFKHETIERMMVHLRKLIEVLTTDQSILLEDIEILSEDERNQVLYEFNDTYTEYPRDKSIHRLFEEQVEKVPDNIALIFNDEHMTYSELNDYSNQIGRLLVENDIKEEALIGIMLERSPLMVASILGTWKASGAYLPIDVSYPEKRIAELLNDSGMKVLISHSKYINLELEKAFEGKIIKLDQVEWENVESSNLDSHIEMRSLAYVIYTSGSTGKPKGVMIEHQGMMNHIHGMIDELNISERSVIAQNAPHCFDISIWQFFTSLVCGGTIVIYSNDLIMDIDRFMNCIIKDRVNLLQVVPSFLEALIDRTQEALEDLNYLLVTGEELKPNLIKRWFDQFPNVKMVNAYGPAEASDDVTLHIMNKMPNDNRIPVGKPFQNMKIYIVDEGMNLCPIGVKGEIAVSGIGVGRGYLNNQDKTDEVFMIDPFRPDVEQRLYKTGDLGRWLPEGTIEFLGRIDHQVKIRGFRIELGEIENQLLKLGTLKEAVVIAREDVAGDKYLCAYYVSEEEIPMTEIRQHLSESLPEYMMPLYFIQLEKLPLTANGKLDRKALPKPVVGIGTVYVAPRDDEERVVAKVFEEVLGIENVGAEDDFFILGGDSIKAIRIVSKLRVLGYELSVQDLMRTTVVDLISKKLKKYEEKMLYEQGEVVGEFPLTPIQRDFFASDLTKPNHYNQSIMLKATERINRSRIESILDAIVEHHDILRTIYWEGKQRILSSQQSIGYEMKEYDYRATELSGVELAKEIEDRNSELQASINIETGPLMKVGLFRTEEADHLMICIHHLVIDGVSWRILIEDLETGYQQYLTNTKIRFPEKTASFKDWSDALDDYSKSDELMQEMRYWQRVAEGMLGGSIQLAVTKESGIGQTSVTLSAEETSRLLYQSGRAFGTEINDLLLSGLGLAIQSLTGQQKVNVNLEGHGREMIHKRIDIDRTVGWFTSVYPINIEVTDDVKVVIIKTKEMLRKIPNKGLGYGVLKYLSEMEFDHEEAQIVFNYLGDVDADISTQNALFGVSEYSSGRYVSLDNIQKEVLDINCIVLKGKLSISIDYRKDKLSDDDAKRLGTFFIEALRDVINVCMHQEEVIKTSSDFKLSDDKISQSELEEILGSSSLSVEKIYGLTSLQEGMLFHNLINMSLNEYIVQAVFQYKGVLDVDLMRQSLSLLSIKHEVLRSTFITTKVGKTWQAILKDREIELNVKQVEDSIGIEQLKALDVSRGFNFKDDSLFRVSIIQEKDAENIILFTIYHIISDGWSSAILLKEILENYEKLRSGRNFDALRQEAEIEKSDMGSYQEYIHLLEQKDKEAGLQYWELLLAGYDEPASISPIKVKDKDAGSEVKHLEVKVRINIDISKRVQKFAQEEKITLSTVAESAWGIVLQKYSQTEDVVFGKVVSGRDLPIKGIEKMAGLFINTIPIRIQNDENTTIRELLKDTYNQGLESSKYDYCSLAEVQSKSELGRHLFNTLFLFQNFYVDSHSIKEEGESNNFSILDIRDQTNYSLCIIASCKDDYLHFDLQYDPSVYEKTDVEFISKRLKLVIMEISENPDKKISNLDFIDDLERNQLLYEFNDTHAVYPREKTIHQLFEEQVKKTPDKVAVVFEHEQLTYKELNEKANALAHKLRGLGVGSNDYVGIMAERSIEMIVGIYGIIKAGGAYVPLDPTYPIDRINYILKDCQPKVLLIRQKNMELEVNIPIIELKSNDILIGDYENLGMINQPNSLIYLMYTSGTTGRPKGVMVKHRGVVNLTTFYDSMFCFKENSRIVHMANVAFDGAVFEIFPPLIYGATIFILEKEKALDRNEFHQFIRLHEIQIAQFVPMILKELLAYDPKFDSLDKVVVAGDQLDDGLKDEILSKGYQLTNHYGPTETTVDAIVAICTKEKSTIGKPIANTRVYILDSYGNPVPIHVVGEIYVAGEGVAKGYINKPELTAEKFMGNPFISEDRMYRTGDLARWLPDGNIEFLGRIDHQVKIRGFRIELTEIESRILRHEVVQEAIVLAREDTLGDKYLCAYIVSEEEIPINGLKKHISEGLPHYMIPSHFVRLKRMPLTSTGKVDRKALPEPMGGVQKKDYVAPRNSMEEALAQIWSEILSNEKVGIYDDFFDLGGHSLKAVMAISKMNSELEITIPLAELYENPNIAYIGEYIKSIKGDNLNHVEGLILLRKGKEAKRNFFIVHAGYDDASSYIKLANSMNDDFNYWGINYERPDSYDPCVRSMEQLAEGYIEKIKRIQAKGSYYVSGWCFGGTLAFEIARQLEAANDSIDFIGLYNSTSIGSGNLLNTFTKTKFTIKTEFKIMKKIFLEFNLPERYKDIKTVEDLWNQAVKDLEDMGANDEIVKGRIYERMSLKIPLMKKSIKDHTEVTIREIIHFFNLHRGFDNTYLMYKPKEPIKSKISYFIATKEQWEGIRSWNKQSMEEVDFYNIDAEHYSMFEDDEDVRKLANTLTRVLNSLN